MAYIVTSHSTSREDWLLQLADVIVSQEELLHFLNIQTDIEHIPKKRIKHQFPLRVPRTFASRIEKGNPNDPLLKQVLISQNELIVTPGFDPDPLKEQDSFICGLLHKYLNRVLLLVKNSCAINCRYCFRRYFPYQKHSGNKSNWQIALDYIASHSELDEVIFSGGDPLMAKDSELCWLISQLENIAHIKRLRIHSRLPIVIPSRITCTIIKRFKQSRLQILLVNHINHAKEINDEFREKITLLRSSNVTLLNQSVLLRGVNDDAHTLADLSNSLFDIGIIPYYLHMLDKVQGASHFMVSDNNARHILRELLSLVSGYMVPKLVRDINGELSKTPIDLQFRQK